MTFLAIYRLKPGFMLQGLPVHGLHFLVQGNLCAGAQFCGDQSIDVGSLDFDAFYRQNSGLLPVILIS
ncbi:MAG TPA: hypothetical protein VMV57_08335 [Terracidiphilus sp.]|nr:hypothetical protein [Terracidiphilus sp.]